MRCFFTIIIVLCVLPFWVKANEDIIVIHGKSQLPDITQARKEIHQQAIETTALNAIESILGHTPFEENLKQIKKNIMPKKDRFILFSKNSNLTVKNGVTSMSVTLRLSLSDLKAILLSEGFLKFQTEPVTVLPLFVALDEVQGIAYRWWLPSSHAPSKEVQPIKARSLELIKALQKSFSKNSFLFIDPIQKQSIKWIPQKLQKVHYKKDELMLLAAHVGAQILLIGHIRFKPSSKQNKLNTSQNILDIKLSALHSASGKIISESSQQEVVHHIPKTLNAYDEMIGNVSAQTLKAWQIGRFRLDVKRLILLGSLTFQQLNAFKQTIQTKMPSIRNLRERLFKKNQIVFEVETDMEQKRLIKEISQMQFNTLHLTNPQIDSNDMIFQVN